MVAGVISGKMVTSQHLRIEERAVIHADIEAGEAIVAGEVQGNLTVQSHLEVLSTARINGDIKAGSISIQQGAILNGKFTMIDKAGAAVHQDQPRETEPVGSTLLEKAGESI